MIVFKQIAALQNFLQKLKKDKCNVGFVPTMGALHDGHSSLLKKSKQVAGKTVCSIFVNPTQFNNTEDFKKYPVNIEQDIYLLEKWKCDVLFLPDVKEIYPDEEYKKEVFNLGNLENILEEKYRPGHFQGVCMVVKSLLNIVQPSYLLAGQKDYQQCLVLQKLLHLLNSSAELIICPIIREKDGLAMSSRNLRLNENERQMASEIFNTLSFMQQQIKPGKIKNLKDIGVNMLLKKGFKVDYVEIAKADDLQSINEWNGNDELMILSAAFLNDVRLIDNVNINMHL